MPPEICAVAAVGGEIWRKMCQPHFDPIEPSKLLPLTVHNLPFSCCAVHRWAFRKPVPPDKPLKTRVDARKHDLMYAMGHCFAVLDFFFFLFFLGSYQRVLSAVVCLRPVVFASSLASGPFRTGRSFWSLWDCVWSPMAVFRKLPIGSFLFLFVFFLDWPWP